MELQSLMPTAAELRITFPDGTPTGVTFTVVGQDSKQFRDVAKKIAAIATVDKPDLQLLSERGVELVAACVTGWAGITSGGEPIPYSPAKAVELLGMPELTFMREQVEGFVAMRTNFFRKSREAA